MKIILDTHIFLWALASPGKIKKEKRFEIEILSNIVYVSAISITELMIKASLGKLKIDFDPVAMAEKSGFELLNFTGKDALRLKELPYHHRDPFDRMIIAQGMSNNFPIMTEDEHFRDYECKLI